MTAQVLKSEADSLGFDLRAAVTTYKNLLTAHARTVGVPAPSAHPLVETIVKRQRGEFQIVDDTPRLTPAELRSIKATELAFAEVDRINAILSPARRELASIHLAEILVKPPEVRSQAEARVAADIEALFDQIRLVQRRKAELAVELEEAPDQSVATWSPSWER